MSTVIITLIVLPIQIPPLLFSVNSLKSVVIYFVLCVFLRVSQLHKTKRHSVVQRPF